MNISTNENTTWENWYETFRIYARSLNKSYSDWKFWYTKYKTGITPKQAGINGWRD